MAGGPQLKSVFRWGAAGAAGALAVLLVLWAVYVVRGLIVQVFIAMFIAVSLDPAVRWLVRHKVRRPWAVLIVILCAVAFIAAFLLAIVPPLVQQARSLIADLPGYLEQARRQSERLQSLEDQFHFRERLEAWARTLPEYLGGQALDYGRRFLGVLASWLLTSVLAIYFMLDLPKIIRRVVGLFPETRKARAAEAVGVVVDKIGSYMIGNIVISLIAGAASYVALELLGVPFALPLAFLVAVTDLIPMIGATLGAVICILVALAAVPIWPQAALVAAFFVLYQQIENYLIQPRVMRNAVDMPAIAVLLAALAGGQILGLLGALMAIPIAAAAKIILTRWRQVRKQAQPEGAQS
ncbi:AI-2E family transporter [Longispora albida]|uniref:AI-2E family transporter n=1 Tax=Longispora albida TaxID=203523 RepID=UPI0012FA1952|nr:AI-2E family transporter [Longispora albida]